MTQTKVIFFIIFVHLKHMFAIFEYLFIRIIVVVSSVGIVVVVVFF